MDSLIIGMLAILMMMRGTGQAGVFPLAGEKSLHGLAGVTGTTTVDFNPLALENIHRSGSHVARQEKGNAPGLQNHRNIGLASAARERRQNPGFPYGILTTDRKQTVLPTMTKMVINGVVEPGWNRNYYTHFSAFCFCVY
jgi:hypothetical protein